MSTCKSNFAQLFKEVWDYTAEQRVHVGINEMYEMDRTYWIIYTQLSKELIVFFLLC